VDTRATATRVTTRAERVAPERRANRERVAGMMTVATTSMRSPKGRKGAKKGKGKERSVSPEDRKGKKGKGKKDGKPSRNFSDDREGRKGKGKAEEEAAALILRSGP